MGKFILNILLFLLPLLILVYLIDILISNGLAKSNDDPGEFEVWTDIYNDNIDCDLAIYGSSRAWVHFNSKLIEDSLNLNVYNFGIDGYNFSIQYLRHLEFIKHNKLPKHVILSCDIFSLGKRKDLYQLNQFLPYMLWNKNMRDFTHSYIGFNAYDYYIPLIRYFGKYEARNIALKHIGNNRNRNLAKFRYHGYKGVDKEWNTDFEKAKATIKEYNEVLDGNTIILLENFIKECKQKNINVILVYSPEYIDGQKFVTNRVDIINVYKSLANKYNLEFLDYSNSDLSYNKELFYNASHMNSRGADLFTNTLIMDLKSTNAIHGFMLSQPLKF